MTEETTRSAKTVIEELMEDIPAWDLVPSPLKSNYPADKPFIPRPLIPLDATELVTALMVGDTPEDHDAAARAAEIEQQKRFLVAYMSTFNPEEAATLAHLPMQRVHRWLKAPVFKELYGQVQTILGHKLEGEAVKRAYEGSDRLLIKLLEAFFPEKYGKTTRVFGAGPDGAINVRVTSWAELAQKASITEDEKSLAIEVIENGEVLREVSVGVPGESEGGDDLPERLGRRGPTTQSPVLNPLMREVLATLDLDDDDDDDGGKE